MTKQPKRPPNKRKLTALFVVKVRPREDAFLVWDTLQRGLALQVQPTGYKALKAIYRHHNRPRWYHLGAADGVGLAAARKRCAEIMNDVMRDLDPQAERESARRASSFAQIAERYLNEDHKKRNKSWEQHEYIVQKYLLPEWGKLHAKAIARSDVRAMMGKLAPSVANQSLAAASTIFSWAVAEEIVPFNPCRGVKRNKMQSRARVLSAGELPLVWSAFDSAGLIRSSALKVLLLTGQRPGEVSHMRWEHVRDGWWTMPGEPTGGWPGTKNSETHRVWLPQMVQEIIAELNDGQSSGFVFTHDGRRAITGIDDAMRAICQQLGVERATPHDLRRTHGTTITELGFGREAMNRVQNHREGGIADVYDRHEYAEENKRVMEAVAGRILALALGKEEQTNVLKLRS